MSLMMAWMWPLFSQLINYLAVRNKKTLPIASVGKTCEDKQDELQIIDTGLKRHHYCRILRLFYHRKSIVFKLYRTCRVYASKCKYTYLFNYASNALKITGVLRTDINGNTKQLALQDSRLLRRWALVNCLPIG